MAKTSQLRVCVQRNQRSELLELPFAALIVGSASHCDVRLAPDEAAEQLLSLTPEGEAMRVRALVRGACRTPDGQTFEELVLASQLTIVLGAGAVSLRFELLRSEGNADARKGSTLKQVRQALMLLGLAVGYYFVLREPATQSALAMALTPPALFGTLQQTCPQREAEAARALSLERLAAAEGKRERSPFSMRDGVEAVPLYEIAAACLEQIDDPDAAGEARRAAAELRTSLQDELHRRHVRLEWFLARAKYEAARREAMVLRGMLAGRADPYTQWLSSVERELVALLAQQQKQET